VLTTNRAALDLSLPLSRFLAHVCVCKDLAGGLDEDCVKTKTVLKTGRHARVAGDDDAAA